MPCLLPCKFCPVRNAMGPDWAGRHAGVTQEDLEGLGLGQARTIALVQCLTHAGRLVLYMRNGQRTYQPAAL